MRTDLKRKKTCVQTSVCIHVVLLIINEKKCFFLDDTFTLIQKHIYSFTTMKIFFNVNSCFFNIQSFFFNFCCQESWWWCIDIMELLNNWWTFSFLSCFYFSTLFQFIFHWINTKTIFKYIHYDDK